MPLFLVLTALPFLRARDAVYVLSRPRGLGYALYRVFK
jgi:hypothetical protein